MNAAKAARLAKEAHPERYCHDSKCLWRVSTDYPCPRHGTPKVVVPECLMCGVELGLGLHKVEQATNSELCKSCAFMQEPFDPLDYDESPIGPAGPSDEFRGRYEKWAEEQAR